MNSTALLFILVGIFLIVNAKNILGVFQGTTKIGAAAQASRTTVTTLAPATTPKGQAGG